MSTRRVFLAQAAALGVAAAASEGAEQARAAGATGVASPRLKTTKVPQTDLVTSRLAFGCAMLGLDWNSPEFVAKTEPVIHAAYDNGITFFDMADIYGYGKAETAFGNVLRDSPGLRHKLLVQTKCGDHFGGAQGYDSSREHILAAAEGSLRRLGTDHLDILLLHWPDSLVEPDEVAAAFDELRRTGKVRYFGVSNHSAYQIELLKKSVREPLVINQIQLGLAHWYVVGHGFKAALTHGEEGVATLDYCRLHDIQVQAYSPLKIEDVDASPNLLSPAPDAPAEIRQLSEMLSDLGRKHGVGPAAIMLAWLLRHPAGIVPIIGATKPEHVIADCAADAVNLSREEWYALLRAAADLQSPKAA